MSNRNPKNPKSLNDMNALKDTEILKMDPTKLQKTVHKLRNYLGVWYHRRRFPQCQTYHRFLKRLIFSSFHYLSPPATFPIFEHITIYLGLKIRNPHQCRYWGGLVLRLKAAILHWVNAANGAQRNLHPC